MSQVFGFGGGLGLGHVLVVALATAIAGCSGSDGAPAGGEAPSASEPKEPVAATPAGETSPSKPTETPPSDPKPSVSTPPSVVSTSPSDGAKGVKSDAKVVIKFDRPMDAASVAAAYVSLELPADQAAFTWNGAGDELTITPNAPLAYSAGGPDVGANGYSVGLTTAAKDKAGNALAAPLSIGFSTLRRITVQPPVKGTLSGRVFSNGVFSSFVMGAGDYWNGATELSARALLTFDLATVPDSGIEIEQASIGFADASYQGTPDIGLGFLSAHHVFYSVAGADAYAAEPMAGINVTFSVGNPNTRKAVVTDMVKDDLANRAVRQNRSQYRLNYASATSGDSATDMVMFDKSSAKLTVVYVAE